MKLPAHSLEVPPKLGDDCNRQGYSPILIAFARPDQYLATVKIHILHAKRNTFQHPESAAVHECRTQSRHCRQLPDHIAHLAGRQYHRKTLGPLRPRKLHAGAHWLAQNIPI
jgi:hypothetical protein